MARQKKEEPTKHRLLVYYNLGKRYRGPGLLLIFLGIIMFLPSFIDALENDIVSSDVLATAGGAFVLIGFAFWLFSWLAIHRSYVQINPDLLLIRTPFRRTHVSYRRIKQIQPVQVVQLFPRNTLKGMAKPLLRPLLAETAVEMIIKSWPESKRKLLRRFSPYMFSPRSEAWLFIVPNYSALIRQLDTASQRKVEEERGVSGAYEDPIERLKYYGG